MRRTFASTLLKLMDENNKIVILTGDLGYGVLDEIKKKYEQSGRYVNCGISEQFMVGMAAGMASQGFIPVCFSISSFLLYRPFEFILNHLHHDGYNVKLVAIGQHKDYGMQGYSHWMKDDVYLRIVFSHLDWFVPINKDDLSGLIKKMILSENPSCMILSRY